jgi:arylformamidase
MPPLRLFIGGNELPELKRQSQDYAKAAQGRGTTLPDHHHFSILDELTRPNGALTEGLLDLIKLAA